MPEHEHQIEWCDGCRSMWLAGYRSAFTADMRERHSYSSGRLRPFYACPNEDHAAELHRVLATPDPSAPAEEERT